MTHVKKLIQCTSLQRRGPGGGVGVFGLLDVTDLIAYILREHNIIIY